MPETFAPGQLVTWAHVPRGGYFSRDRYFPVDGVVVGQTRQLVVIRIPLRDGTLVERRVRAEHLRPRVEPDYAARPIHRIEAQ